MTAFAYLLTVILAVSGDSPLLIAAGFGLICLFVGILLVQRSNHFVSRYKFWVGVPAFISMLLLLSVMPLPNSVRFFQAVFFLFGTASLWAFVVSKSADEQARFLENVLKIYLLGSIIHVSGALGEHMEHYKILVQHDLLSNLRREGDLGLLGQRFFGFFSEPSYFAAHYALICAALFQCGSRRKAGIYLLVGFVLCPSPNFILAVVVVVYSMRRKLILSPRYTVLGLILIVGAVFLTHERLSGFYRDISIFLDGGYALTSFSQRLILPILELSTLLSDRSLPLNYSCVANNTCSESLSKLPVLTIWAFFSLFGVMIYVALAHVFSGKPLSTVLPFLLVGTVFAGGGAFVPHFAMIFTACLFFADLGESNAASETGGKGRGKQGIPTSTGSRLKGSSLELEG